MTQTKTPQLTGFLLARIEEDEAVASRLGGAWADGWDAGEAAGRHLSRWSPARVLTECDAKRRIIEEHRIVGFDIDYEDAGVGCVECGFSMDSNDYCLTLRFLALPYANHPDYLPEWRP